MVQDIHEFKASLGYIGGSRSVLAMSSQEPLCVCMCVREKKTERDESGN